MPAHILLKPERKRHILSSRIQLKFTKNDTEFSKVQTLGPSENNSDDEPGAFKIDQCLQLLANLSLDSVQVIQPFKPQDFAKLLAALAETHPQPPAKLTYLYHNQKLLLMKPSAVHEAFLAALNRIFTGFACGLGHDKFVFNLNLNMNSGLYYRKEDGSTAIAIPDLQLVIENNAPLARGLRHIPKWLGEVCFTVATSDTRVHLQQIIDAYPDVDLAFIITIHESPKWKSPSNRSRSARTLSSRPFLEYDDFVPTLAPESLGPVIVGDIQWISLSQVTFELYIRGPDDTLTINADRQDDHSAYGTLYPTSDMSDIDCLFTVAAERLKGSLVKVMEASQGSAEHIQQVRHSTTALSIPWNGVLLSFRTAVLTAAHGRYREWYDLARRKRPSVANESPSHKRLRVKNKTPLPESAKPRRGS